MPKVGDVVIYGTGGVCRIRDKKEECFGGTPREYYILERLSDKDHTTIFARKADRRRGEQLPPRGFNAVRGAFSRLCHRTG